MKLSVLLLAFLVSVALAMPKYKRRRTELDPGCELLHASETNEYANRQPSYNEIEDNNKFPVQDATSLLRRILAGKGGESASRGDDSKEDKGTGRTPLYKYGSSEDIQLLKELLRKLDTLNK